jgi:trigger factor
MLRKAQQSGQNPQEYVQHMMEHNHVPELVAEVVRGKALARIVEAAQVIDASGNPVELKNLRPDGTIGEPQMESESEGGAAVEDEAAQADEAEPAAE